MEAVKAWTRVFLSLFVFPPCPLYGSWNTSASLDGSDLYTFTIQCLFSQYWWSCSMGGPLHVQFRLGIFDGLSLS